MNTPVKFEIAKMLKEKGFSTPTSDLYIDDELIYADGRICNWNLEPEYEELENPISAPTITEVVMWLYEKYGIWLNVEYMDEVLLFGFSVCTIKTNTIEIEEWKFNTPTEAYEAAIECVLTKLI